MEHDSSLQAWRGLALGAKNWTLGLSPISALSCKYLCLLLLRIFWMLLQMGSGAIQAAEVNRGFVHTGKLAAGAYNCHGCPPLSLLCNTLSLFS